MAIGTLLTLGADIFNRLSNLRSQRQNAGEWNAQQAQNRRVNAFNAGRANAIEQNFNWGTPEDQETQNGQTPYKDYM